MCVDGSEFHPSDRLARSLALPFVSRPLAPAHILIIRFGRLSKQTRVIEKEESKRRPDATLAFETSQREMRLG